MHDAFLASAKCIQKINKTAKNFWQDEIKPLSLHTEKGVVLEWLKRHAWKACVRQKRTASSNLAHSAKREV